MSYNNPIPIILDEEDEQWFYEPLTRLLNNLLDEKIIIYGDNYFAIKVPIENLSVCIERFKEIGLSLGEYKIDCTLCYGVLELNAKIVFDSYFRYNRKRFLNLYKVNSEIPKYLKIKGDKSFCEVCCTRTCMDETPYCVRLYIDDLIESNKIL